MDPDSLIFKKLSLKTAPDKVISVGELFAIFQLVYNFKSNFLKSEFCSWFVEDVDRQVGAKQCKIEHYVVFHEADILVKYWL